MIEGLNYLGDTIVYKIKHHLLLGAPFFLKEAKGLGAVSRFNRGSTPKPFLFVYFYFERDERINCSSPMVKSRSPL